LLFVAAVFLAVFVVPHPWGLVLVSAAAVVELAESWFWIRFSRRWRIRVGAETLIGLTALVVSECRPLGQVRVHGELWRASCAVGAGVGETVRVVGRDGLTLLVAPE
jgi:membrane-bound serine protease (ClpP class)